ncbi:MAG: phosphate ABC transporter permease family protein, partial [Methyloceanibacter sp.]
MIGYLLLAIIMLSALSYLLARRWAVASVSGREQDLHSRPTYHGAFVA